MPTFKAKIFNQKIDLNYQEGDKSKLLNLIQNLNSHWTKYDYLKGKVSDIKILILLALELQDVIYDLKSKIKKDDDINLKANSNNIEITKLSKDLITHKDKVINLELELKNLNIEFKEVNNILDEINNDLKELSKSIINSYEN